jgi:hypothetical protein
MTTHLGVMILFAAGVAAVFGALARDEPRQQWGLAARILVGLVMGAYVAGWLMYLIFA